MKSVVKASFARCAIWNRKEVFSQANCIMPISVGQGLQVHEGEKFAATVGLINASFKKCTLLIDDAIQRHTMKIFSRESDSLIVHRALLEGEQWLLRNKKNYDKLSIEHNIVRWNDWLMHPDYLSRYKVINDLYNNNNGYKIAIQSTINDYITRNLYRLPDEFMVQRAKDLCLEYLKEECAVMCLWAAEGYDFEVYPSGRSMAMQATHEMVVLPEYPNKIISVSIRFKKSLKNS